MEPLLGRTVSQIKNRFYQSLKGKDIKSGKIKIENLQTDVCKKRTVKAARKECVTPNESSKKQRLESELTMSSMPSLMQCSEAYQLQNIPKLDFELSSSQSSKNEENSEVSECGV